MISTSLMTYPPYSSTLHLFSIKITTSKTSNMASHDNISVPDGDSSSLIGPSHSSFSGESSTQKSNNKAKERGQGWERERDFYCCREWERRKGYCLRVRQRAAAIGRESKRGITVNVAMSEREPLSIKRQLWWCWLYNNQPRLNTTINHNIFLRVDISVI